MKRLFLLLWLGVAIQLAGEVVDLRWHATHDEFEGAADQVEAHWLIWLGALLTLTAAAAAARSVRLQDNRGVMLTLVAGATYVGVSIWHFAAHASGTDPEVAHVMLGLGKIGILAGVIWATVVWRRTGEAAGVMAANPRRGAEVQEGRDRA
jgi:hypothetical protein